MFYIDIDIAKYKHEAYVIDLDGKPLLDSISFANTKDGCEKLITLFEKLNISKHSFIIAQVMRFGQFSSTTLSEENILALRQLSRYRLALVD